VEKWKTLFGEVLWCIFLSLNSRILMAKKKKKPFSKFHVLIVGVLGLIVIFLIVQMVQFVNVREDLVFLDSIEANNATVIGEMSVAKSYLMNFGADLNQIREYLLLPTTSYNFGDLGVVEELEEAVSLTAQVFTFIDRLGEYEEKKDLYDANLAGITEVFADGMWGENFLFAEGFEVYDDQLEGMEVLDLTLDLDGTFMVDGYHGEMEFDDNEDLEEVKAELTAFVEGIEEFRNLVRSVNESRNFVMNTVVADAVLQEFVVANGIGISAELEVEREYYYYSFLSDDGIEVVQVRIYREDAGVFLGETEYEVSDTGFIDLFADLQTYDFRTALEKLVDESEEELQALMNDKAFAATLEGAGLSVGEVSEDDLQFSYPILDEEGAVIRVLYLDKTTGEMRVKLPDDDSSELLSVAIDGLELSSKKKLWTCPRACLSMVS
jgi:hypothetical protein